MKSLLLTGCLSLSLPLMLTLTPALAAQQEVPDTEQLGREQAELLRKAERLRDLMKRLLVRYSSKKEDRKRQVELIQEGLKHLEESGLLRDAAAVRSDLDAHALAEANRTASRQR
ncbi:MAG: hypothetical protein ACYTFN_15575 [Planctomycetota bacterium]|jgi:hypothetical protein